MITAYHRPTTLEEALTLLRRTQPVTVALGGGTALSREVPEPTEVVDLQALGLDRIVVRGEDLIVGATATLQALAGHAACPDWLARATQMDATLNLRNTATVAGTLVTCDGRSTLAAILLAADATLDVAGAEQTSIRLGDFLPFRLRSRRGALITSVSLSLDVKMAIEHVARTPADTAIVGVAVAKWRSGRIRAVVSGFGTSPLLALDGKSPQGIEKAVQNALENSEDAWASVRYREDMGKILARRAMHTLE